jgi:hypothetical protein
MSLQLEGANGGTFVLTKVGLAIGSTATGLSTAASATYVLDGVFQTAKAATATFPLTVASGFALSTVPIGSKAAIGVWVDSAGALTVTQGAVVPANTNSDKAGPPPAPAGCALLGVATVFAATAAFIPGTTAFNAAGVTTTYFDTFSLPNRGF